jgi:hypothetical protein
MPGYGQVGALLIDLKINEEIKKNIEPEKQKDAYKYLTLSEKGGDISYLMMAIGYGGIFLVFFALVSWIFTVLAGLGAGSIIYYLVRRRQKAREELEALVKSNPEYWKPLVGKLEEILRQAGAKIYYKKTEQIR